MFSAVSHLIPYQIQAVLGFDTAVLGNIGNSSFLANQVKYPYGCE
jgi:hypothetical protein